MSAFSVAVTVVNCVSLSTIMGRLLFNWPAILRRFSIEPVFSNLLVKYLGARIGTRTVMTMAKPKPTRVEITMMILDCMGAPLFFLMGDLYKSIRNGKRLRHAFSLIL